MNFAVVFGLLALLQLSTAYTIWYTVRLNFNGREITYMTKNRPGTPEFDKERYDIVVKALEEQFGETTEEPTEAPEPEPEVPKTVPTPAPPKPVKPTQPPKPEVPKTIPTPAPPKPVKPTEPPKPEVPKTIPTPAPAETGLKMDDAARKAAVDTHNNYRSLISLGKAKGARRGKNIYKLEYSMELEKQAQEWANTCLWKHSDAKVRKAGENLHQYSTSGELRKTSADIMVDAANGWWSELAEHGVTGYTFSQAMYNIGHWTQMAWGTAVQIGCGLKICPKENWKNTVIAVCQYRPTGNMLNSIIYEEGQGCGCTHYPNSQCEQNTMLCIKPKVLV